MSRSERYIPSGIKPIDNLIGGWRKGIVTLLVGESGAGKSTMLIASAYSAAKRGIRVNYIDTEKNPLERAVEKLPEDARRNVSIERATRSMESLEDAVGRLRKLPREVLNENLIIVDSITYHYHLLMRTSVSDSERDRLQARLEAMMYSLHQTADESESAVVVTTWPTSIYGPESDYGDYVGGFAVKVYSRTHLRVYPSMMSNRRIVEVAKYQDPRIYGRRAEVTMDEIMKILDMLPLSGVEQSIPPGEGVEDVSGQV
jgi:KaiC/GvpD/RAD55 family RecA-like ATPase